MAIETPRGKDGAIFTLGRSSAYAPGIAASFLLHGLVLALILFFMMRSQVSPPAPTIVPVDLIRLGEQTQSPPAPNVSPRPQQRAEYRRQEAASPVPPAGASPKSEQPVDILDARLRALARLRQPESHLHIAETEATSNVDAASDASPGDEATYSIRDYVRAQVERRWSLDLQMLGRKNFVIPIRIEIARNGTVTEAAIVDKTRFGRDPVYRYVAISARNAVLLSSPIQLPLGTLPEKLALTLDFNPRDVMR